MPSNQAFVRNDLTLEAGTSKEMDKERTDVTETTQTNGPGTAIPLDTDSDYLPEDDRTYFSWSKMCDVLGNRQSNFISTLRPIRAPLIYALQALKRFELELERNIKSKESADVTAEKVQKVVDAINTLTTHTKLNIPPDENEMLRGVSYELIVLQRVIEEVAYSMDDNQSSRSRSASRMAETVVEVEDAPVDKISIPSTHSFMQYTPKPTARFTANNETRENNVVTTTSRTYDEHSLKERIGRNCDRIEQLIRFVDQKCERRWWLRDLINFLQLFIKLALFISATVSVVYHQDIIPSILTLAIAVVQGVIELLDQYFIKHKQPDDVRLTVFTGVASVKAAK